MFASLNPVAFHIGNYGIRWYGIIMSFAMLCAVFTLFRFRKKFFPEISVDEICDISFLLIITGIISARLYYVFLDYKYFLRYPSEIPAIHHGGIAIQGAIIGGIIAGILYARIKKINFFKYADLFSFALIVGQIIGRWGNFFNSEAFGLPSSLPWAVYIPYECRPLQYSGVEFFHPAFLYESLLNIIVFALMYLILTKFPKRKDGCIFCSYLILYSIVRIVVETVRVDSVLNIGIFHIAHIISGVFIAVSLCILFFIHKEKNTDV